MIEITLHGHFEAIKDKYGAEPDVQYFETPVVVDNVSNEIVGGANVEA